MSTRATIELYNRRRTSTDEMIDELGVSLYHHHDGDPVHLGPKLEQSIEQAKRTLHVAGKTCWWDSERIGALIISQSVDEQSDYGAIPFFQPCGFKHKDISFVWRVYIGPEFGHYEIAYTEVRQTRP